MELILLAYSLPKETVAAIMILYKNTKVKVRSPDGDTEYFDIVAGVLQGDTLAPYLFMLFTNPSARAGYDTRSIFKRSLTGLNSEFSFS